MGKMKDFLIRCIDNKQNPEYTLTQVAKHRVKYESKTKETESGSKGLTYEPFVPAEKSTKS